MTQDDGASPRAAAPGPERCRDGELYESGPVTAPDDPKQAAAWQVHRAFAARGLWPTMVSAPRGYFAEIYDAMRAESCAGDPDPDAIALGTLEALQGEVNATIDGMKAKYLVNARKVPLQMPPGGADLYANPGFEEAVRLAVTLARVMRQHGLENVVVNGLGFVAVAAPVFSHKGDCEAVFYVSHEMAKAGRRALGVGADGKRRITEEDAALVYAAMFSEHHGFPENPELVKLGDAITCPLPSAPLAPPPVARAAV